MDRLEMEIEGDDLLDHDTSDHYRTHPTSDLKRQTSGSVGNSACLILTYLQYVVETHVKCVICLAFLVVSWCAIATISRSGNDSSLYIKNDYSDVQSYLDLEMGSVDHWCLDGSSDACKCNDPLEALDRGEIRGWVKAHKMNIDLINENTGFSKVGEVDLVLLGDSLTEHWGGRGMGKNITELQDIQKVFHRYLTKAGGASFDSIPLGVASDTCPNLLWRLYNGEIPEELNPKVWWIVIGINDFLRTNCSEEVVLLGILRIVEEIEKRKPGAIIVINGLLPTTSYMEHPLDNTDFSFGSMLGHHDTTLWPSILEVNAKLEQFSEKHDHVKYFDPMSIFVHEKDTGHYMKKGLFMTDGVHPSKRGYREWAKAIVEKMEKIIK